MTHPTTTTIRYQNGYRVEVSDTSLGFHHRICQHQKVGTWVGFESIAQLKTQRHCTGHYDGVLPCETLFSSVRQVLKLKAVHQDD